MSQNLGYFSNQEINITSFNPAFSSQNKEVKINVLSRNNLVQSSKINQQFASIILPFHRNTCGFSAIINSSNKDLEYYNTFKLGFSYKVNLWKGNLSFGTAGVVNNVYIQPLLIKDANDVNAPLIGFSNWTSDLNFGLMYQDSKIHIGAGVENIIPKNTSSLYYSKYLNYYFSGYYNFNLAKNMVLNPSIFMRILPHNYTITDFNLPLQYLEKFALSVGYRTNQSLLFSCNIELNKIIKSIPNRLKLSYCFDYSIGNQVVFQAHEISLMYSFERLIKLSKIQNLPIQHSPIFF